MTTALQILAASLIAAGFTVWLCRSWYREGYIEGVRHASHANMVDECLPILDQPMPARPAVPMYPANAQEITAEFADGLPNVTRGPWGVR